jgi:uncharacterized protein YuzE
MKPIVRYDAQANAACIRFSDLKVLESEEVSPGVVFDYDAEGRLVAIELLDAKAQLPPEILDQAA